MADVRRGGAHGGALARHQAAFAGMGNCGRCRTATLERCPHAADEDGLRAGAGGSHRYIVEARRLALGGSLLARLAKRACARVFSEPADSASHVYIVVRARALA